jgi:pimeloyl-ACP methyl ester carboxylesterase
LRLVARDYGSDFSRLTPVLCLPGLTRNAKDFETVAQRLSPLRRVICPDFRGRGRSQYAGDPLTYRPDQELADTLALLDRLGIGRVAAIGTSRGGIVAMVMAAKAKERLAGVLLNDIGPRIETAGLIRIRTYLGTDPAFASWQEAVAALKRTNVGFDTLSDDEWLAFAKRVFREEDGKPRTDYDGKLTATFPAVEDIRSGKVPELWGLLDLMTDIPVTVLRGEQSDLLSAAIVTEMTQHAPALEAVTVANRGHVPFLGEAESEAAIDRWLARIDAAVSSSRQSAG